MTRFTEAASTSDEYEERTGTRWKTIKRLLSLKFVILL